MTNFRTSRDFLAANGRTLRDLVDTNPLGCPIPGLGKGCTDADSSYIHTLLLQRGVGATIIDARNGLFSVRWVEQGCPVFSLTEGLAAKLLLTDPSGIDGGDIRLPFPAFLVEVPDGYFRGVFGGVEKDLPFLALHDVVRSDVTKRSIGSWDTLRDIQEAAIKKGGIDWEIFLLARKKPFMLTGAAEAPPSSGSVAKWLDYTEKQSVYSDMKVEDKDNKTLSAARLLVANLVLYLGSLPKLPPPHRVKSNPRKGVVGGVSRYELGGDIKLSAELRAAAKDRGAAHMRTGWKLRSRYVVRGHWRSQPCGPGRAERKRIWIAPHWKGPHGDALRREYEVLE